MWIAYADLNILSGKGYNAKMEEITCFGKLLRPKGEMQPPLQIWQLISYLVTKLT